MAKEFEKDFEAGTEGGRSPSGVPASGARPVVYPPPESSEEAEGSPQASPPEARAEPAEDAATVPRLTGRRRGPRTLSKPETRDKTLSAEERILVHDTWKRSWLRASEFGAVVGLSPPTLYIWRRKSGSLTNCLPSQQIPFATVILRQPRTRRHR